MQTNNDLASIEARIDEIEDQLRAQAGHLRELHRCVARLQAQVASIERGGHRGDVMAEFNLSLLQELARREAKVVTPEEEKHGAHQSTA